MKCCRLSSVQFRHNYKLEKLTSLREKLLSNSLFVWIEPVVLQREIKLMLRLRTTVVNLIRYQWFVFTFVLRFWLQDWNEGQTCCTEACGEQPDEEGLDGDVKDSSGTCLKNQGSDWARFKIQWNLSSYLPLAKIIGPIPAVLDIILVQIFFIKFRCCRHCYYCHWCHLTVCDILHNPTWPHCKFWQLKKKSQVKHKATFSS